MNIEHKKPGYILAFTLALMALFIFIATYVSNKGLIFSSFSKTMVDREKARQLAYGGIQLAISQLSVQEKKAEAATPAPKGIPKGQTPQQPNGSKELLKAILPTLGRLQRFTLNQNIEGIAGSIGFMITSEDGKININRMYDFEKHKFIGEPTPGSKQEVKDETNMKKMFQELFAQIREQTGADLFNEFEKFLRERKYPLNDVTELLTNKGFEVFKENIFYDPTSAKPKSPLYLTDIFTVAATKQSIEPWLISNSLAQLLKMQKDPERVPAVDDLLKNFKEKADWKNDWNNSLKNLYGIDFAALPKFVGPLLNPVFDPKFFTVFSFGTVGSITVRLVALLERHKTGKEGQVELKIRKIYTL